MIEVKGDLWRVPCHWICIPTNGIVRDDGSAVMGAGVALQAVQKVWNAPMVLGEAIKKRGNKVHFIGAFTRDTYVPKVDPTKNYQLDQVVVSLYSFPTKHHYKDPSDLNLIEKSCDQIKTLYRIKVMDHNMYDENVARPLIPKIVLPRVGCGLGKLNWEKQVRPVLYKYFGEDDNFIIVSK